MAVEVLKLEDWDRLAIKLDLFRQQVETPTGTERPAEEGDQITNLKAEAFLLFVVNPTWGQLVRENEFSHRSAPATWT